MLAPEKRREKRFKRRLRVVFEGDGSKVIGGYTTNLSPRGMQVSSAMVFPAGSLVKARIELPDGKELLLDARVRWAIKTQGIQIMRQTSMGLELLGKVPDELIRMLDGAREDTGTPRSRF